MRFSSDQTGDIVGLLFGINYSNINNNKDPDRELNKLWNMEVTMIPIITGALGTISKGFFQDWNLRYKRTNGDQPDYRTYKIDQNTEKSSGGLMDTCCHSNSRENPSADAGGKNSQMNKIIIMMLRLFNNVPNSLFLVSFVFYFLFTLPFDPIDDGPFYFLID